MIFVLLALHLGLAALALPLSRRLGRAVLLLTGLGPAAAFAWGVYLAPHVLARHVVSESYDLAPSFGFALGFRVDEFALLMALVVSGIGTLVFVYSYSYFSSPRTDLGKFAAVLSSFAASMFGLVLSDNLLGLFVFWEATSLSSYLLIGFNDRSEQARAGALQAILTTGLGGLVMLAGFVIVGQAAGTYSISEIVSSPPSGRLLGAGLVCILVGAFTKSAQAPFHAWLPSAMAAPTPVSAYLHSATMVKAGVFLIARLTPAFSDVTLWRTLCVWVGAATMLLGAWRALRQFDLKLLLAHGTVSSLGSMVLLFGLGEPKATFAGVALLLAHALYKAALFMSAGIVDRCAGTRDIRSLDGVGRAAPWLLFIGVLGVSSMAGVPPTLGFVAKEEVLAALLDGRTDGVSGAFGLVATVVASALTVAYGGRFLRGAFGSRTEAELRLWDARRISGVSVRPPDKLFLAPAGILVVASLSAGLFPASANSIVEGAAAALLGDNVPYRLALWHGFGVSPMIAFAALIAGWLLYAARGQFERLQSAIPRLPSSLGGYRAALSGLLALASRATGVIQCGSLPVYLTVIAVTAVVVSAIPLVIALTNGAPLGSGATPSPVVAAVSAMVGGAALAAAAARNRFSAVVALGGVGYGVGVLFVAYGAPDLALTQFAIETLMLIVFVMVLRYLPSEFPLSRIRAYLPIRLALSLLVAGFVFAFGLLAAGARDLPAVSDQHVARAIPEAHGKNVVNLILVDFRALDTMGEITVLAVAALGTASFVMASRGRIRTAADGSDPSLPATEGRSRDSAAGKLPRLRRRSPNSKPGQVRRPSTILETGSRAIFQTILLFSLYLFFSGHDAPGGGFIAGLVAGGAIVIRYLAVGSPELQRILGVSPETVMGSGLALAVGSGIVSLAYGEAFESAYVRIQTPVLGEAAFTTSLVFDLGVYLTVIGLVMTAVKWLGREEVL